MTKFAHLPQTTTELDKYMKRQFSDIGQQVTSEAYKYPNLLSDRHFRATVYEWLIHTQSCFEETELRIWEASLNFQAEYKRGESCMERSESHREVF